LSTNETNIQLKKEIEALIASNEFKQKQILENNNSAKSSHVSEREVKKNLRSVKNQIELLNEEIEYKNGIIKDLKLKLNSVKRSNM